MRHCITTGAEGALRPSIIPMLAHHPGRACPGPPGPGISPWPTPPGRPSCIVPSKTGESARRQSTPRKHRNSGNSRRGAWPWGSLGDRPIHMAGPHFEWTLNGAMLLRYLAGCLTHVKLARSAGESRQLSTGRSRVPRRCWRQARYRMLRPCLIFLSVCPVATRLSAPRCFRLDDKPVAGAPLNGRLSLVQWLNGDCTGEV